MKTRSLWRYRPFATYALLVSVGLTSLASFAVRAQSADLPVPRFETGEKAPIDLPTKQTITFGYLVVREDRSQPQGKTIRLPVAILRSRSATPKADPVVYTAGGPGGSSLQVARFGQYYKYLDDRDLIVFEQRGTRYAQPCLDCPEVVDAGAKLGNLSVSDPRRDVILQEAASRCRDRLTKAGIDLGAYTTRASADDLEDLRQVLGIQQWNLYGVSYSTRLMLEVMRRYPQTLRSVVLDSPLPPQVNYDEESVTNWVNSLELLLADCAADSACGRAFPNLKQRLYQTLERINQSPIALTVVHPKDSTRQTLSLKGADVAKLIDLGSTGSLAGLPRLLDQICRGEYAGLQRLVQQRYSGGSYAWGMRYCIWCREELPFARPKRIEQQSWAYPAFAGLPSVVIPEAVCQAWAVGKAEPMTNEAVRSTVPTLIIGGQYDPDTPPHWARLAAKTLPNSYVVEMKGMSHNPTQYWSNLCGMELAQAFFTNPLQAPVAPCLQTLTAPRFVTGGSGK